MKLQSAIAFLKRWSRVRITPGTLLFSRDLSSDTPPYGPPKRVILGVSGTNPVHGRDHYDPLSPLRAWTPGGGR